MQREIVRRLPRQRVWYSSRQCGFKRLGLKVLNTCNYTMKEGEDIRNGNAGADVVDVLLIDRSCDGANLALCKIRCVPQDVVNSNERKRNSCFEVVVVLNQARAPDSSIRLTCM
jgi:hypothetical protein